MSDTKITVTKLDAAKRQLRTAIRLWFADDDPVAIHTLAAAAHEIVHTLFRRKGLRGLLFDNEFMREEKRSEFAKHLKLAPTFFKHAQRDAEASLQFNPTVNEGLLLFSIMGLSMMGEPQSIEEDAFNRWFHMHHPELLTRDIFAEQLPRDQLAIARQLNKSEFFQYFKLAAAEVARRRQ